MPTTTNTKDTKLRNSEVTIDIIHHNGAELHTLVQGTGDPIVILPSLGRGAEDYDEVAEYLDAAGHRVIRPQPRGIGGSTGPMEKIDLHDLAGDVAAVLDHLGVKSAVVVGHAFGSQPARMLSVDRPDLVKALVMAAASAGKVPEDVHEKPYGRLRAEIDGAGNPSLSEEERLRCLRAAFFAPGNDPRVWLDGWSWPTHEMQTYARNNTPIDEYWAGGDVPLLDLQAAHDAVVIPNIFRPLLGDRVRVDVIAGAGHAMAPERPEAMSNAILKFIASLQHVRPGTTAVSLSQKA
jgi:pimeloyl-ACP methyl ester carboxylesterase